MLVFRDGRKVVSGPQLASNLADFLQRLSGILSFNENATIDALLCAGQLECALVDAQSPAAEPVSKVTDALAAALLRAELPPPELQQGISEAPVPHRITVSRPEGFSYYALHPLDFADVAAELPVRSERVAVIGIRSIGTTLSAIVATTAQNRRIAAERITVRPTGHPWDRSLNFKADQLAWVCTQNEQQAEFWVVDEGPGLSGSSFLAVAEALVAAGIPCERITLLGSAPPDLACLRAPNAAARWGHFRSHFTRPQRRLAAEAAVSLCAGEWRHALLNGESWPASWTQFERAKFLSADRKSLFKFEGFGPYGREVRERAAELAGAGFGPNIGEQENGYLRYDIIKGQIPTAAVVSETVLDQIATYCAWRVKAFATEPNSANEIDDMARTNAAEGLGAGIELPKLRIEVPVLVDGRMHPHEWRLTPAGRLLKLDAASHGDDHFFPGPTDIAWDLAGAIIEWRLSASAADRLIEMYREVSGDDPRHRLPEFVTAYALFRLGYCSMAAESLRGTAEQERFDDEIRRYRAISFRYLAQLQPA